MQTGEIAVEKHDFSTLSTDLSTEVVHKGDKLFPYILVYISYFDSFRRFSYFFAVQHVAHGCFLTQKIGLDKKNSIPTTAINGGKRKKVKKGIDFIEKVRYNRYLRELESRQEV